MTVLFECEIEVKKHAVKKNGRNFMKNPKTGRMFLGKDKELVQAENNLTTQFERAYDKYCQDHNLDPQPITDWVFVEFIFKFPKSVFFTKKGTISKNLPDLSNLYELPQDCLQKAQVIDDDWQINGHTTSMRTTSKNDKYILSVKIFKIDAQNYLLG